MLYDRDRSGDIRSQFRIRSCAPPLREGGLLCGLEALVFCATNHCEASIIMKITPFYAAVLGLLFVLLSVRTLRLRRKLRIAIGTADSQQMLRAMRVHANFAEYAPFTLLLAFMVEFQAANDVLVHALCLSLLVGRTTHAYGVSMEAENYSYRVFGMAMTFAALVGAAVSLLFLYGVSLLST